MHTRTQKNYVVRKGRNILITFSHIWGFYF
jgi:hypothetical protein